MLLTMGSLFQCNWKSAYIYGPYIPIQNESCHAGVCSSFVFAVLWVLLRCSNNQSITALAAWHRCVASKTWSVILWILVMMTRKCIQVRVRKHTCGCLHAYLEWSAHVTKVYRVAISMSWFGAPTEKPTHLFGNHRCFGVALAEMVV